MWIRMIDLNLNLRRLGVLFLLSEWLKLNYFESDKVSQVVTKPSAQAYS